MFPFWENVDTLKSHTLKKNWRKQNTVTSNWLLKTKFKWTETESEKMALAHYKLRTYKSIYTLRETVKTDEHCKHLFTSLHNVNATAMEKDVLKQIWF